MEYILGAATAGICYALGYFAGHSSRRELPEFMRGDSEPAVIHRLPEDREGNGETIIHDGD